MKYFNGQVYRKPCSKAMPVIGAVLIGLAVSIFLIVLSVNDAKLDGDSLYAGIFLPGIFLVPGVILLVLGLIKVTDNKKEYQRMLKVDYEKWRTYRLNDPKNPLFRVNCYRCNGVLEYDRPGLDGTRMWFPDGFVVCPNCGAIIRHDPKKYRCEPTPQAPAPDDPGSSDNA